MDSLQIQLAKKSLPSLNMTLIEFASFAELLKKEEGFLWLKSLEDTYITEHVDKFTSPPSYDEKPLSSKKAR